MALGYTQEVTNYDKVIAGTTYTIATVPLAASQTVKRGDLLVCAVTTTVSGSSATGALATNFSKAAAVAAPGNLYMIAAEDADTTSGAGKVLAYGAGYYNQDAVALTGDLTTNKLVLLQQGIVLVPVQSGEVTLPDED